MEEKKNKSYDIFFRVLFVFFIMFICLYGISMSGFVENKRSNKTLYTEEQIDKFESDVMNGKEIDINKYIEDSEVDYSNTISDFGELVSNIIDDGADYSYKYLEKFFKFLFE